MPRRTAGGGRPRPRPPRARRADRPAGIAGSWRRTRSAPGRPGPSGPGRRSSARRHARGTPRGGRLAAVGEQPRVVPAVRRPGRATARSPLARTRPSPTPRSRSYRARRSGSLSQSCATLIRLASSSPAGPAMSGWCRRSSARHAISIASRVAFVGSSSLAYRSSPGSGGRRHRQIVVARGSGRSLDSAVSFLQRAREAAEAAAESAQHAAEAARTRATEVGQKASDPAMHERLGRQAKEAVGPGPQGHGHGRSRRSTRARWPSW